MKGRLPWRLGDRIPRHGLTTFSLPLYTRRENDRQDGGYSPHRPLDLRSEPVFREDECDLPETALWRYNRAERARHLSSRQMQTVRRTSPPWIRSELEKVVDGQAVKEGNSWPPFLLTPAGLGGHNSSAQVADARWPVYAGASSGAEDAGQIPYRSEKMKVTRIHHCHDNVVADGRPPMNDRTAARTKLARGGAVTANPLPSPPRRSNRIRIAALKLASWLARVW